jgi:hypothetical protein
VNGADGCIFDTSNEMFHPLTSREYYRTEGFTELALQLSSTMSYRQAAAFLNRVRWQTEGGTPMRTLASIVESEGSDMKKKLADLAEHVLAEHQFDSDGKPQIQEEAYGLAPAEAGLSPEVITKAVSEYNRDKAEGFKIDTAAADQLYEDPRVTVNVSIDDVGVKKQKENGRSPAKKRKETREYVHNTIAHVEKENSRYILNGSSTEQVLKLLVAFLLHNGLFKGHYLQFFIDGARSLQAAILNMFQWLPHVRIILDWYHLKKKCEYELSLVMKGSKIRNAVLEQLLPILWLGKVDVAIEYVRNISPENLKTGQSVEGLIGYFERNREYIPCYALRHKLGLRNSSNKGEKANDLCVASRQKHNGMSWSKQGSVALTTVTAMHINNELRYWYSKNKLNFKLVS